ncbi:DNA-dependent metalloprotease SPRTN-like [Pseudophryne corroboree]|uniref:DNA-dependent metalloprotease SPRTN-like n=1 Tax=Pseudophryne corroboree TaxID=495146 RepID=UPI0030812CBA
MEACDRLGVQDCTDESTDDFSDFTENLSIVDEAWETIDPNPDIQELFTEYNDAFFQGKLADVPVEWSNKLKTMAGVCKKQKQFGGPCRIRLSRPILEQMPRRTTVECLLHEMIHAYLYVSEIQDTSAHGEEFVKEMERINYLTGANVTIYLDFYEEEDALKTHWWQCDRCLLYRKKMVNRAPSMTSEWWALHEQVCGGEIHKVMEPPRQGKENSASSYAPPTRNILIHCRGRESK